MDTQQYTRSKKIVTEACFIGLEKAFDQVRILGLIVKLIKYQFCLHLFLQINDMINCKKFFLNFNLFTSREFKVQYGLQKSTVHATSLFSL